MKPTPRFVPKRRHPSPSEVSVRSLPPLRLSPDAREAVSAALGRLRPGQAVLGIPSVVGSPSRGQKAAVRKRKEAHRAACRAGHAPRRLRAAYLPRVVALLATFSPETLTAQQIAEQLEVPDDRYKTLRAILSENAGREDAWVACLGRVEGSRAGLWGLTEEGRAVAEKLGVCP